MKIYLLLLVAFVALACGEAVEKKTGENNVVVNNANNGNNANNENNGDCPEGQIRATVNGATGCFTECVNGGCDPGFTCAASTVCVADVSNNVNNANNINNANNVNNVNNANNQTMCETRADCRVDQECSDTLCEDHLACFDNFSDLLDGGCELSWAACEDDREYLVFCEAGAVNAFCSCLVNGVETGQFTVTNDDACFNDREVHRVVNEQCGWLVPAL